MIRSLVPFALAALLAPAADAHDFWLEPATFAPEADSVLATRVMIGHASHKEPYARNPAHVESFSLWSKDGAHDVAGRPGADPAGQSRIPGEGVFALTYVSQPTRLEMEAGKFEAYLREEGLERVIDERKVRGETESTGVESYSRCAKALVRTPGAEGVADRTLGLPLEITALSNPFHRLDGPASTVSLSVTAEGRPVAGVLVTLESLDEPSRKIVQRRTDERGRVTMPLTRDGRWLVAAVHMNRAKDGADHDWRSHWASLSFEAQAAKRADG